LYPSLGPRAAQSLLPLDLRPKKTRAIRQALTKEQKRAATKQQAGRARAFPRRKFALKA
jgi:large subunit ribosomal protein L35e